MSANPAAPLPPSRPLQDAGRVAAVTNGFLQHPDRGVESAQPRAYVNWILFDEQLQYVTGGFSRVHSQPGTLKEHVNELQDIVLNKSGYVYIYVSNESPVAVFFDNLQVVHTRGPLLEETHYYPFGLMMAGISSKAAGKLENKRKFNSGSELQSGEFTDGSGLELFDAINRGYDPQIGRFWQVDELAEANWEWTPYNYAINNPISFNDPLGLKEGPNDQKTLPEVVVTGYNSKAKERIYWHLVNTKTDFSRVANPSLRQWIYRYDGIQKFKDRVHELQREQETVMIEVGSIFFPMGWITKLKYLKYAERLFFLKRSLTGIRVFKYASTFGIKTYSELKSISPFGSHVHHLIEKRFASLWGQAEKDMASIVLTKEEHKLFTNAWRSEIGYDGSKSAITTSSATKADVEVAARKIYKNYPEILKAIGL